MSTSQRSQRAFVTADDTPSALWRARRGWSRGLGVLVIATAGVATGTASPAGAIAVAPQFAPPVITATSGTATIGAAIADLNGDGSADVVTADYAAGSVDVMLGAGDGSLLAPTTFPTGGSGPEAIATADLDADGSIDVVVADGSGTVQVLMGLGTGALAPPSAVPTGGSVPFDVVAAHLDGDGIIDLATANYGSGTLSVLRGLGDGGFAAATTYPVGYVGSHPFSLATGDLDGDADADLAVASRGTAGAVSTFVGAADGTFTPSGTVSSGGAHPHSIAFGDLDADGFDDVVVSNVSLGGTFTILRANGLGGFAASSTVSSGGQTTAGIALADLTSDGALDVGVINTLSGTLAVLAGNGDGSVGAPTAFTTGSAGPVDVAFADVDADGRSDAVVTHATAGTVSVLLNATPPALVPTIVSPAPGSIVRTRRTITVRAQVSDSTGALVSDAEAAALVSPTACRVFVSATGVKELAPTCMRYDARRNRFVASLSSGRVPGSETITVSITSPSAAAPTTASTSITIVR